MVKNNENGNIISDARCELEQGDTPYGIGKFPICCPFAASPRCTGALKAYPTVSEVPQMKCYHRFG